MLAFDNPVSVIALIECAAAWQPMEDSKPDLMVEATDANGFTFEEPN